MGWFSRTSKPAAELRQWTAEPIIPPFPGATLYGYTTPDTPEAALQVPAVWSCVRLKADAVGSMELNRYREGEGGAPVKIDPGPLLTQPSGDRTMPEWLFDLMVSGELRGNVFGHIVDRDDADRPTQIELVAPDNVKLEYDQDKRLVYRYGGQVIPRNDVWHLRGYSYPGSPVGLSAITYAATTIGLAAFAEKFGASFFADGAHPSAILYSDHPVDQLTAQTIKDRFRTAVNGREPAVLGLGVKYQAVQISPEESQFLATQQFSVSQIARIFGVPASLIGGDEGKSMTYQNVEQRSLDFLVFGIQPWLRRIEVALSALLPPGEFVRFDVSNLLRVDAETRAKVQAVQVASKTRTLDELRLSDGLPPLTPDQLEVLELVPLEVTPMGTPKTKPGATAPGDEAPAPRDDKTPAPARAAEPDNTVVVRMLDNAEAEAKREAAAAKSERELAEKRLALDTWKAEQEAALAVKAEENRHALAMAQAANDAKALEVRELEAETANLVARTAHLAEENRAFELRAAKVTTYAHDVDDRLTRAIEERVA